MSDPRPPLQRAVERVAELEAADDLAPISPLFPRRLADLLGRPLLGEQLQRAIVETV